MGRRRQSAQLFGIPRFMDSGSGLKIETFFGTVSYTAKQLLGNRLLAMLPFV